MASQGNSRFGGVRPELDVPEGRGRQNTGPRTGAPHEFSSDTLVFCGGGVGEVGLSGTSL